MATHLLTGAGSGIGAVLARRLVERGDDVVVLARDAGRARQIAEELPGVSTLVGDLAWSAYAASKHGLRALADALRQEEAQHGIRVTSVYPGRTATPMQERVHRQEGQEYDATRFITPEAVATTILTALDLPRDAHLTDLTVRPQG